MLVFLITVGCLIGFLSTTIGAMAVFFVKKEIPQRATQCIYGFASGIMLSATFFALIIPAIEQSNLNGILRAIPCILGILVGMAFMFALDYAVEKLKKKQILFKNLSQKNANMFIAVTMHNIPEGLIVGLSFGVSMFSGNFDAIWSSFVLAFSIGIQNIPEGAAISLPLLNDTKSKFKAFLYGGFSGIVEPIGCAIGILCANFISQFVPILLSFSAGMMICVLVEELIPEMQSNSKNRGATITFILGFVVMLLLDCL